MPETASLALPLLVAEQAQKHVTHNEALRALDAIVQTSVKDRDLATPPGSPADGDRYIVAASATDEWAAHEDEIAAWQDGAWGFYAPREGWRSWVDDEDVLLVFDGAGWADYSLAIDVLQNLSRLGVGTTADATNPFAAKLNKALWTALTAGEGGDGDLRYTLNKETAADVLSLLLQSGFSGRAEIGLISDDDLSIKVSPDGSAWSEAVRVDKDTGAVDFPSGSSALPKAGGTMTGLLTVNGQIKFPAAQNASADPNTLDDYEEGSWTPSLYLVSGAFNGASGLTVTSARYTRIGNIVQVCAVCSLTGLTPAAVNSGGTVTVGGLPFTPADIGVGIVSQAVAGFLYGNLGGAVSTVLAGAVATTNRIYLFAFPGPNNADNDDPIFFNAVYRI
jgi:hypothetical protein